LQNPAECAPFYSLDQGLGKHKGAFRGVDSVAANLWLLWGSVCMTIGAIDA
jgi:hypothetical protein